MDAQLLTVQKLEEKERALQGSLGGVEKELTLRSQALELNKRKVRAGPVGKATEATGSHSSPLILLGEPGAEPQVKAQSCCFSRAGSRVSDLCSVHWTLCLALDMLSHIAVSQ